MLPSYYKHVSKYENSLVTKFFGVHCVKPVGGQKVCLWLPKTKIHSIIEKKLLVMCFILFIFRHGLL